MIVVGQMSVVSRVDRMRNTLRVELLAPVVFAILCVGIEV